MFSIPYRNTAHEPYWGPVTAHANFCEEDYIISPYVAEVVSTVTSFSYLYYAYHGIRRNDNRKDAVLRYLPYLGLAAVGILSAVFHSTLKQYTQWFDDLSMHIATTTVLHRAYTFDKPLRETVITGVALTVVMTAFAIFHCWTDEFLLHVIVFGSMITAVGIRTRRLIATRIKSASIRKQVRSLVTFGTTTFVTGFILWNLDNILCSSWRGLRRNLGMPWSFLFELHGWWHLLTGAGAYTFIALVEYLTSDEAGQALGNRFAWPVGKVINTSIDKALTTNGHANGKVVNGKTQ